MFKFVLPILMVVFLFQGLVSAEYYKWEDEDGTLHITDYPPPTESAKNIQVHGSDSTVSEPDAAPETGDIASPIRNENVRHEKVNCIEELKGISTLPPHEKEKHIQAVKQENKEQLDKAMQCLNQGDYGELERHARMLRTSKARDSYGGWKLEDFYDALSEPFGVYGEATDQNWQSHIAKLEKWVKNAPGSITARTALGDAWVNYAWKARGAGMGYTVTDKGAQSYEERIQKAEHILSEARQISEKCPHWYEVMLIVARAQGWDTRRYNQIFDEAVRVAPLYTGLYLTTAEYLLPKWQGNPGDVEKFAEKTLNTLGGKQGYYMYYMIASRYSGNSIDKHHYSWPKVIKGYESAVELYGERVARLNIFCNMAVRMGDDKTARRLMKRIGTNIVVQLWDGVSNYNKKKEWAFQSCIR